MFRSRSSVQVVFLYVARVRAIRVLGFESRRESFSQWQRKKKNARVITAGARGCFTCVLLLSFRNDDCSIDQLNTVDWTQRIASRVTTTIERESSLGARTERRERASEQNKRKTTNNRTRPLVIVHSHTYTQIQKGVKVSINKEAIV